MHPCAVLKGGSLQVLNGVVVFEFGMVRGVSGCNPWRNLCVESFDDHNFFKTFWGFLQKVECACVWSNGAWSRLCLWITDGGSGLSHLPPLGEDSSVHVWCWKLYGSRGEVQAVHGLCRRVFSKRKALPKMVPATHGKSRTYHASIYFLWAVRDPLWIKICCVMKTQSGSPLLYIDGATVSSLKAAWYSYKNRCSRE